MSNQTNRDEKLALALDGLRATGQAIAECIEQQLKMLRLANELLEQMEQDLHGEDKDSA